MKILAKNDTNEIVAYGDRANIVFNGIEIGEGIVYGIAIDEFGNFIGSIPQIFDVAQLPEDFQVRKYLYQNGEFVLNPNWKPYIPPEERITQLEQQIVDLQIAMAEMMGV